MLVEERYQQAVPMTHRSRGLSSMDDCFNFIQLEQLNSNRQASSSQNSSNNSLDFFDLPILISLVNEGMKNGVKPMLADGAMGGTYFLRDTQKNMTIVCKPGDEEPNSPHNPYQISSHPSGWGAAYKGKILPGFGMYREVAAYLLDYGFAGVPPTQLARVRDYMLVGENETAQNTTNSESSIGYKICSVQSFVRSECSAEDMGPGKFFKDDVQRIAVMDIRLCNLDRHEGNMLVSLETPYRRIPTSSEDSSTEADEGKFHLIPIDHGYVLPHVLHMSDPSLAWIHWPQANEPLSDSVRQHVEALDYTHDAELLRRVVGAALPETSLLTLRVCTAYLKKGVAAELTLKELGQGMLPDYDSAPARLVLASKEIPQSLLQKAVHLAVHRAALHACAPIAESQTSDDSVITMRMSPQNSPKADAGFNRHRGLAAASPSQRLEFPSFARQHLPPGCNITAPARSSGESRKGSSAAYQLDTAAPVLASSPGISPSSVVATGGLDDIDIRKSSPSLIPSSPLAKKLQAEAALPWAPLTSLGSIRDSMVRASEDMLRRALVDGEQRLGPELELTLDRLVSELLTHRSTAERT